jgi:solute carrier family 25 oxoglutarate transporter 11
MSYTAAPPPPPPAPPPPALPIHYYFIAGGLGDISACLVSHPLDTVKVRQQLSGELSATTQSQGFRSLIRTTSNIISKEGLIGVYTGLSASIMRQSIFSTLRHGAFATVCTAVAASSAVTSLPTNNSTTNDVASLPPHPSKFVTVAQAIVAGAVVGAGAAFVANPSDVALVRMQSDRHWPVAQRRNYRHVGHAITSIVSQKGWHRLWRGCGPTVLRASLVTTTQIPTYHATKQVLLNRAPAFFPQGNDDSKLHVVASIASAGVASIATCPVDVVKTRIINMQQVGTAPNYSSAWDCVAKTIRAEGVRGMFKGLAPTFVRLGPHTVVLWNVQEFILRTLNGSGRGAPR